MFQGIKDQKQSNINYLKWIFKKKLFWLKIEFNNRGHLNFSEWRNWVTVKNYSIWKSLGVDLSEVI